jgi:NAD(P) transhydrogenase subunit alpha
MLNIFLASALAGYKLIKNVPSLLHTPLMSGMNALSGVTVIGAVAAAAMAARIGNEVLGGIAIVLAVINIVGGFGVTGRMLAMFKGRKKEAGG